MKFLLIQPNEKHLLENAGDRFPQGLLALSAWIKKLGHECKVIDMNHSSEEDFHSLIRSFDPLYLCIAISTPNYLKSVEFAKKLKAKYKDKKLVAGGTHMTDLPDEKMTLETFDHILVNEGEMAIKKLIDGEKKQVIFGEYGDVNEYPIADYDALDMKKYSMLLEGERCANIVASRGCLYNCSFCGSAKIKKWRPLNIKRVIDEMIILYKKYDFKNFYFGDDIFTKDKNRTIELCNEMIQVFEDQIKWRATTRADLVDKELLQKMYDAGCRILSLGCESGSLKVLKAIRKGMTPEQNLKAVQWCHEIGLKTKCFFIGGLPESTYEDELKTLEFAKELKKNGMEYADYYIYTPYPNTPIWNHPEWFTIKIMHPNNSDWSTYYQVGKQGFPPKMNFIHPHLNYEQLSGLSVKFKEEVTNKGMTYT